MSPTTNIVISIRMSGVVTVNYDPECDPDLTKEDLRRAAVSQLLDLAFIAPDSIVDEIEVISIEKGE